MAPIANDSPLLQNTMLAKGNTIRSCIRVSKFKKTDSKIHLSIQPRSPERWKCYANDNARPWEKERKSGRPRRLLEGQGTGADLGCGLLKELQTCPTPVQASPFLLLGFLFGSLGIFWDACSVQRWG